MSLSKNNFMIENKSLKDKRRIINLSSSDVKLFGNKLGKLENGSNELKFSSKFENTFHNMSRNVIKKLNETKHNTNISYGLEYKNLNTDANKKSLCSKKKPMEVEGTFNKSLSPNKCSRNVKSSVDSSLGIKTKYMTQLNNIIKSPCNSDNLIQSLKNKIKNSSMNCNLSINKSNSNSLLTKFKQFKALLQELMSDSVTKQMVINEITFNYLEEDESNLKEIIRKVSDADRRIKFIARENEKLKETLSLQNKELNELETLTHTLKLDLANELKKSSKLNAIKSKMFTKKSPNTKQKLLNYNVNIKDDDYHHSEEEGNKTIHSQVITHSSKSYEDELTLNRDTNENKKIKNEGKSTCKDNESSTKQSDGIDLLNVRNNHIPLLKGKTLNLSNLPKTGFDKEFLEFAENFSPSWRDDLSKTHMGKR